MHAIEIRFHAVLNEKISQEETKEIEHLTSGRVTDWADYKRRVGVLEGLARARDLAKFIADQDANADRDLRQMIRDRTS